MTKKFAVWHKKNELPKYKENLFKPNYANAAKGNFPPELDEIVIFPSKTQHSTITNETSNDRMSISGDISIISKNSENLEKSRV